MNSLATFVGNYSASKGCLCRTVLLALLSLLTLTHFSGYRIGIHHVHQDQMQLQWCGCHRSLPKSGGLLSDDRLPFEKTTCGRDAFLRGSGQKIIAFSFYESENASETSHKKYFEGILGNLNLMPEFYPGWVMRLYFDLPDGSPTRRRLCEVACSNPLLDLCDASRLPGMPMRNASRMFAMNWRFFPTLDGQVDYVVPRDLDSRFTAREQAAVAEWLDSDKDFHLMRDHPEHGAPMMGSGWGVKMIRAEIRQLWKEAWRRSMRDALLWHPRTVKGPDQFFLGRYVYKWARNISIGHDAYTCHTFSYTSPFPTRRELQPNNFIGAVWFENVTLKQECPEKCRKKPHWIFC